MNTTLSNSIILHSRKLPRDLYPQRSDEILKVASLLGKEVKCIRLGIDGHFSFSVDWFNLFLKNCTACEVLDFSYCNLQDKDLKIIAKKIKENNNHSIKEIKISNISRITEVGLEHFRGLPLENLVAEQCSRIQEIPQLGFPVQIGGWVEYSG